MQHDGQLFERFSSPLGVVVREAEAVQYGVYSDDDIRRLSVVQVHSSEQRDALNRPLPGGLYDPKMGPTDHYSSCPTCGLDYSLCPGHLGRIDLPLPVYLPALFPVLVQLLRGKCLHCHAFRIERERLWPIVDAMGLINAGLLVDAATVLGGGTASANTAPTSGRAEEGEEEEEEEAEEEAEEEVEEEQQQDAVVDRTYLRYISAAGRAALRAGGAASCKGVAPSTHLLSMRKEAFGRFVKTLHSARKCAHCHRHSDTLKAEGGCKIFCVGLSQKLQAANAALGDVSDDGGAGGAAGGGGGGDDDDDDDDDSGDSSDSSGDGGEAEAGERSGANASAGRRAPAPAPAGGSGILAAPKIKFMTPKEAWRHAEELWRTEGALLHRAYRTLEASSFFQEVVPVPPNRFRPPANVGDDVYEHSSNVILGRILAQNDELRRLNAQSAANGAGGDGPSSERVLRVWDELSRCVACIADSTKSNATASTIAKEPSGVKQVLERKEGLFRMNMMGKRVNFTCRSVISPDPNIGTHEIGVPLHFATTLTYPEPITPWNVAELRQAVINGPTKHPGANMVQERSGELIDLNRRSLSQRMAIAKRLLITADADATPTKRLLEPRTPGSASTPGAAATPAVGSTPAPLGAPPAGARGRGGLRGAAVKKVWRHLKTGDAVLVNRQPTLHKPGIMAHTARVLRGEKVIRMHYANCNTYNADFDGDEMNVHMCQTELARAEAYHIAATDHQYIVPTNGSPLRGLIQDHIVMGVLLTKRDTFLPRATVMQLLQLAHMELTPKQRVAPLPPPAILKPAQLWTGKQVISHLLLHLHPNACRVSMEAGTKTPAAIWGSAAAGAVPADEGQVVVRDGELLSGVLDKAAFGAAEFGLVHSVHEVLGGAATGRLLTQLGRLFTGYQQMHGFTCGIADLLLTPAADDARSKLLTKADGLGLAAAAGYLGAGAPRDGAPRAELRAALRERVQAGEAAGAELDGAMKGKLMPLASEVGAACLPGGQQIPFPKNMFALMTSTGAKGSGVNFSQISAMLGQQELEGRRVPLSPSGCTAPCFAPYELGPRAGGYITDRFLTGVRPPEFYFHCMAGREGLVDTAVKTSRSGYLQRCLIKHLEPLTVSYDHSVRSSADGSVIQFVAGEDGLDPTRVKFLERPSFFAMNSDVLLAKWQPPPSAPHRLSAEAALAARAARRAPPPSGAPPPPVLSETPPSAALGATSEAFDAAVDAFLAKPPDYFSGRAPLEQDAWRVLMWRKYQAALQEPGEAVGLLAAQSVGEPSTQMTLNTFHLAGRGEANVTLGIPRMREIIMVASQHPSTPLMTLPLKADPAQGESAARKLASQLSRLRLGDMLRQVTTEERLRPARGAASEGAAPLRRRVRVTMSLASRSSVSRNELLSAFVRQMLPKLKAALRKQLKAMGGLRQATSAIGQRRQRNQDGGDGADGADGGDGGDGGDGDEAAPSGGGAEEANGADEDADDAKVGHRAQREGAYEEPDEEDEATLQMGRSVEPAAPNASSDEASDADADESDSGDGGGGEGARRAPRAAPAALDAARAALLGDHGVLVDFGEAFDRDARGHADRLWFECELPLASARLLFVPLVEELVKSVLVRSTPNIDSATVVPPGKGSKLPTVQTAGVNFQVLATLEDVVDVSRVMSNDIHAVLKFYGVEAARATIVNEIRSVFGVYGIRVDPRHLGLIADYMTHEGGYKPLNRNGIESCASPLQKMSFETTMNFLSQATLHGDTDVLSSPSASIILGKPPKMGSGAFELHAQLGKKRPQRRKGAAQ